MKITASLAALLLLVLTCGCPQQDSMLERSRKAGNVQTVDSATGQAEVTQGTSSNSAAPPPADSGGASEVIEDDGD